MRILFDHQTFHIQRFGGISRYFYELINRLSDDDVSVALSFSMNRYIKHHPKCSHTNVTKKLFKVTEGVFRRLNKKNSLSKIAKGDFDLFHPTYYDPYFLDALGDKPFVLTIHDMMHERFAQYFKADDPTAGYKRLLSQKARRIIAISENTKRDIIEILGVDEAKIDVVYHGFDSKTVVEGRPEGLPEEYILYVGERRCYKNFDSTVTAFTEVRKTHPDCHLVLTGRKLSSAERRQFERLGLTDFVKIYTDISDDVLLQLYRHARLFVYPSLYEGFGIPILESFSQQCPVVLSNASCFPEVAGDAAEYFDPMDAQAQAAAMLAVMDSEEHRNELTKAGASRLKLFTWDNTVKKTREVYKKVLL